MQLCSLRIDDSFYWCGTKFTVHGIEPPNILIFKEDGERKINYVNYITLISDSTFKPLLDDFSITKKKFTKAEINQRSLLDTLPDERKDKALYKLNIIKPILLLEQAHNGDMYAALAFNEKYGAFLEKNETIDKINKKSLLERISKKAGKSPRTIERYIFDYNESETQRENHGVEGLVSKAHLNSHIRRDDSPIELCHPKKKEIVLDTIYVRLNLEYIPILKDAIEKRFLGKRRRNVTKLHEAIEIICTDQGLAVLDYDTVYKIVKRINPYILERLINGDLVAPPEPINGNVSTSFAKAPLHVIEIDHVRLPIEVIDETTGYSVGEPWLTLAICVRTRMVWGLDLSLHDPSGFKVMNCLFHGICLKRTRERYGTINEWDIHGIPTIIYTDNGTEFKNAFVKSMIEDVLHAEQRFRPVATPRYGGIIERYFRTINQEFLQDVLGVREKSNKNNDERKESEKEAILTLDNLRELLVQYITDIYHHDIHKGLPLDCNTPTAQYYQDVDVMGFPNFIREEDEQYYKIQLLPSKMKSYKSDGIREENVKYASAETARFISNKRKNNCKIKFDVEDISKIYLLDTREKSYIQVPSINPPADEVSGMSRKLYQTIRKILIENGELTRQQIPGATKIISAKKALAEKYSKMASSHKMIRRLALKNGFKLSVTDSLVANKSNTPISRKAQLIAKLNAEKANLGQQINEKEV